MPRPRQVFLLAALALVLLAGLWLATHVSEPPPGPGRLMFGRWQTRNLLVALALLWMAGALLCLYASGAAARRFVVATVSFGAFWIVLEGIGFAGFVSYPSLLGNKERESVGLVRVPGVDLSGTAREDLAESWGIDTPPIPFRFRTDSNGFRNEPDRKETDVVCLGDSFLVDGLVPHAGLVSARLEALLGRTVMCIALVGIGPQEEAELLHETRPALDGRLLLHFVFEGNDLLDSAGYYALKAAGTPWTSTKGTGEAAALPRSQRTLLNQLVLRLQKITDPEPAFLRHKRGRIGGQVYYFSWLRQSFQGLEGEVPRILETLGEVRRSVEAAGGRYAVVLIPSKIRVLGPLCTFEPGSEIADWPSQCGPLPAALSAWCAASSVPLVDLTEPLRASAEKGAIPWFPTDTHWNEIGHDVAARAIAASEPVRGWAGSR